MNLKNEFARNWFGGFLGGFLGIFIFGFIAQSLLLLATVCLIGFLTGYYALEILPMIKQYYLQSKSKTNEIATNTVTSLQNSKAPHFVKVFIAKFFAGIALFFVAIATSLYNAAINSPSFPARLGRKIVMTYINLKNSHPMSWDSFLWFIGVTIMVILTFVFPFRILDDAFFESHASVGILSLANSAAFICSMLTFLEKKRLMKDGSEFGFSAPKMTKIGEVATSVYSPWNDLWKHRKDIEVRYLYEMFSVPQLFVIMSDYYDPKDKYKQAEMSYYYKRYETLSKSKVSYLALILKELILRQLLCLVQVLAIPFCIFGGILLLTLGVFIFPIVTLAKIYYDLARLKDHLPGLLTTLIVTITSGLYFANYFVNPAYIISVAFFTGIVSGSLAIVLTTLIKRIVDQNLVIMELFHRSYLDGVLSIPIVAPMFTVQEFLAKNVWNRLVTPSLSRLNEFWSQNKNKNKSIFTQGVSSLWVFLLSKLLSNYLIQIYSLLFLWIDK